MSAAANDRAALRAELVALADHVAALDDRDVHEASAAVLLLWACGLGSEFGPVVALLAQLQRELAVLAELFAQKKDTCELPPLRVAAVLDGLARRLEVAKIFAVRLADEQEGA